MVNSLLAGRILLLHSPSGAGKTSLIQTKVVPTFEKRDFLICATTAPAFAALRVNLPPPADLAIPNRYVYSVVNGLLGGYMDPHKACSMTLKEAIAEFASHHASEQRRLIILDQLEEVLTLDPGDVEGQTAFFEQLGEALDDDRIWALLSMREDYMGALDRFRQYLPGQLRSTFRLDLLDVTAARKAVQEPARERGVEFDDAAASMLVSELGQVRSGPFGEGNPSGEHPYVEPVLLQVVCYNLFRKLSRDPNFRAVTVKDVEEFRPIDKSIAKYYRSVMGEVADKNRDVEQALRDWIQQHLIGDQRLRSQTRQAPPVAHPDEMLSAMQSRYLIRADPRPGGATSWELSHDMLVSPILEDNRAWRNKYLHKWQRDAVEWRASEKDSRWLLLGAHYLEAPPLKKRSALTKTEQDFLIASDEANQAAGMMGRLKERASRLTGLLVISILLNVALIALIAWIVWG